MWRGIFWRRRLAVVEKHLPRIGIAHDLEHAALCKQGNCVAYVSLRPHARYGAEDFIAGTQASSNSRTADSVINQLLVVRHATGSS